MAALAAVLVATGALFALGRQPDTAPTGAAESESARTPEPQPAEPAPASVSEAPSAQPAPEIALAPPPRAPELVPEPAPEPKALASASAAPEPAPAPQAPATAAGTATTTPPPSTYNEKALEQVLGWAVRNAEECHKGGRPSGTAIATLTFAPAGRVREAKLEGEPIASAAVGKCILSFLRSPLIPPFSGPEFTVTRQITLR